jgi:hypothetical protein
MRFDRGWRKIALLLGFVLILGSMRLLAQTSGRPAIGSLQIRGTVFLEGNPVTSGTSLYPGDTLRTGADGTADVNLPDRGSLVVSANTEIAFYSDSRFASLHQGSIALRLNAGAQNSSIELGRFVLTTEPSAEAAAEVVMSRDGSAHIRCLAGSVGVISIDGPQSIFLQPGEEAVTSPDGRMRRVAAVVPSQSAGGAPSPGQTPMATGKFHYGLVILGVGAGVGGAVAALVVSHRGQPVSPATP